MKRDAAAKQGAKGKWVPPTDPVLAGLPALAQGLTDHLWDDGTPRDPWSLSINWSGPMPTVMINDREAGRSAASTAPTVREAMELLDALVKSEAIPWRYWQQKKGRRG